METEKGAPEQQTMKCIFPPCEAQCKPAAGNLPLCKEHAAMADFLLWMLPLVKIVPKTLSVPPASPLIVPRPTQKVDMSKLKIHTNN